MSVETDNAPRAWNENHPWLQWQCASTDEDGDLRLPGRKIEIRWVFQADGFKEDDGDTVFFRGLAYDREGCFYAISERCVDAPLNRPTKLIRKLTGKAALAWFAKTASWDADFSRELCRAIDNPQFEFMPLVPARPRTQTLETQGQGRGSAL